MSTTEAIGRADGITFDIDLIVRAFAEVEQIRKAVEDSDHFDTPGLRRYFNGCASSSLKAANDALLKAMCQLRLLECTAAEEAVERIIAIDDPKPHTDDLRGEADR